MKTDYFYKVVAALLSLLAVAAVVIGIQALQSLGNARVVVEWSTASELDTAGFNLYRSESQTGPFEKVNQDLIPAAPDPLTGGEYSYTDHTVKSGFTYYYELEDVELSGSTSRHGPIAVKATSGGWLQLILAAFLVVTAGFGFWMLFSQRRSQVRKNANEI